ncbi:MAG: PAS domain-containing protein [Flammeovirgaceae bacterium]|nr:PAS domain-containing protein [Flammeovirgaceae bacterium]
METASEKHPSLLIDSTEIPIKNYVLHCYDIVGICLMNVSRRRLLTLQHLKQVAKKMQWKDNIDEILSNQYQAIVLTNTDREILWVSEGFEEMTGYPFKEVIGKKPGFLQGKNTDPATRMLFRQKLQEEVNFSLNIINYRKNGEEYLCKVDIFPLHNVFDKVSHFLALEQEVK